MPETMLVYTVTELPQPVQQKVLDRYRYEYAGNGEWYQWVYEAWKTRLGIEGFYDVEIQFRGFASQGDGASFTADVDVTKFIKANGLTKRFRPLLGLVDRGWSIDASIIRIPMMYVHENTVRARVETDYNPERDTHYNRMIDLVKELEQELTAYVREHCRKLYRDLEEEYDKITGDEAVIEVMENYELRFTVGGKIVPEGALR